MDHLIGASLLHKLGYSSKLVVLLDLSEFDLDLFFYCIAFINCIIPKRSTEADYVTGTFIKKNETNQIWKKKPGKE